MNKLVTTSLLFIFFYVGIVYSIACGCVDCDCNGEGCPIYIDNLRYNHYEISCPGKKCKGFINVNTSVEASIRLYTMDDVNYKKFINRDSYDQIPSLSTVGDDSECINTGEQEITGTESIHVLILCISVLNTCPITWKHKFVGINLTDNNIYVIVGIVLTILVLITISLIIYFYGRKKEWFNQQELGYKSVISASDDEEDTYKG